MDKEYTFTDKANPKFVQKLSYSKDSYDASMHKGLSDENKLFGFFAGKLAEDYHVDDVESASEVSATTNPNEYAVKCIDAEDDEYSRTLIYNFEVDGTNITFTQSVKY
eukprot:gene5303-8921_t